MGMAGGAYQGDKERAQMALQAAQIANSRRAQEQAAAHQQAVLAEQARQADMANARANRALDIQEGRGGQIERPGRSNPYSVSVNGVDVLGNARQMAQDRRLAALEGQNGMLGQFQQVCDAEAKRTKAKHEQGQATMASMMKMGMLKGGTVPMAALNFANRQFGFDGRTQAIGGAGFTQNGDFFIDFLTKDPNNGGAISRQTQVMKYDELGRVLYSQAGIFTNEDRAKWRKGMLQRGYSTEEVNTMCGLNATAVERLDDAGRQRLDAGYADPSQDGDWKRQLAERKMALMEQKFAASLGQKSLDAAQKYALYHFNDFTAPKARQATEDDVSAGRAKKVGETVYDQTTPDQAFKDAVEFYKKNMGNADPAVNPHQPGGEGGQQAKPPAEPGADPANTGSAEPAAGEPDPAADGDGNGFTPTKEQLQAAYDEQMGLAEGKEDMPGSILVKGDDGNTYEFERAEVEKQLGVGGDQPEETDDGEDDGAPADGQGELDFGGIEGSDIPPEGGEGGDSPEGAPDEGGEGGAGAPPPSPAKQVPAESNTIAGGAGGIPAGEEDATAEIDENGVSDNNPYAKWLKRSKKNRR